MEGWLLNELMLVVGTLVVAGGLTAAIQYVMRGIHPAVRGSSIFILWLVALIVILGSVGVSTGAILLILAVAGFTLAYSLRTMISSYVALHVYLKDQQPFRIGDMVSVGGVTGRVIAQNNFSTIVVTDEGDIIYYPNYRLLEEPIRVVGKGGVRPKVFLAIPRDRLDAFRRRIAEISAELRGMLAEGRAIEVHVKNIFQDRLLVELTIPVSNPNIRSEVVSAVLEKCADYIA